MKAAPRVIRIEVLRYRPEQDKEPVVQGFDVPFTDDMSVLQGLQYIKDELDGTLSFRWSCRMAICGSCGMMINGVPKLSCSTFLRDLYPNTVRVEALAHFPIERDLVIVLDDFITKLHKIKLPPMVHLKEAGIYCSAWLPIAVSFFTGWLAGILGIGGGLIRVGIHAHVERRILIKGEAAGTVIELVA